jgi:hypothetical protein
MLEELVPLTERRRGVGKTLVNYMEESLACTIDLTSGHRKEKFFCSSWGGVWPLA